MSEAKASLRCLRKRLWLRRYQGSARPGSDGVAVELGPPVEEGAVLGDAGGALLGCTGGDDVVLLGGHHSDMQALLDDPTTGGVAVQSVGDGRNHLVGAMRGSGKNALGHGTFAPVDGLVLVNSLPSFGLDGSLLLGLVPWQYLTGWYPVLRSPPCAGFVVLTRWSGASLLPWLRGWVLIAGCR